MSFRRSIIGVTIRDKENNEDISEALQCNVTDGISGQRNEWWEHVERMQESRVREKSFCFFFNSHEEK